MTEIKITCYLPIPELPNYYVSQDGKIYSIKSKKSHH